LRADLAGAPFAAPTAERLVDLGLDEQVRGAAVRAGMILQPVPGVVLLAGTDDLAAEQLADLPQPFTTSEARRHLQTSRRVALALLGHLDRTGRTRRLPDDRRRVTERRAHLSARPYTVIKWRSDSLEPDGDIGRGHGSHGCRAVCIRRRFRWTLSSRQERSRASRSLSCSSSTSCSAARIA